MIALGSDHGGWALKQEVMKQGYGIVVAAREETGRQKQTGENSK